MQTFQHREFCLCSLTNFSLRAFFVVVGEGGEGGEDEGPVVILRGQRGLLLCLAASCWGHDPHSPEKEGTKVTPGKDTQPPSHRTQTITRLSFSGLDTHRQMGRLRKLTAGMMIPVSCTTKGVGPLPLRALRDSNMFAVSCRTASLRWGSMADTDTHKDTGKCC